MKNSNFKILCKLFTISFISLSISSGISYSYGGTSTEKPDRMDIAHKRAIQIAEITKPSIRGYLNAVKNSDLRLNWIRSKILKSLVQVENTEFKTSSRKIVAIKTFSQFLEMVLKKKGIDQNVYNEYLESIHTGEINSIGFKDYVLGNETNLAKRFKEDLIRILDSAAKLPRIEATDFIGINSPSNEVSEVEKLMTQSIRRIPLAFYDDHSSSGSYDTKSAAWKEREERNSEPGLSDW